jgi:hypothetical protein
MGDGVAVGAGKVSMGWNHPESNLKPAQAGQF